MSIQDHLIKTDTWEARRYPAQKCTACGVSVGADAMELFDPHGNSKGPHHPECLRPKDKRFKRNIWFSEAGG